MMKEKEMEEILENNKFLLIEGNIGVGRVSLVKKIASKQGKTLHRIVPDIVDYDVLIGYYEVKEGKKVWVEGVLPEALRKGHWVILEDINLYPYLWFSEYILPIMRGKTESHPDFRLIAVLTPGTPPKGFKILKLRE